MIKVLIVEDDPMVAKINMDYIKKIRPFQVVAHVGDGTEALSYLEHNQVDLIILDIYMPKLNGLDLLSIIRGQFNKVDVIFVTAAKESEAINRGLQLGAIDYLIKPFTFERIRQALEKYSTRKKAFEKGELSQDELDVLMLRPAAFQAETPKGIQTHTLERVTKWCEQRADSLIELELVSQELCISTVTARRYLEYLVQNSKLNKEVKYGEIGRPSYVYFK